MPSAFDLYPEKWLRPDVIGNKAVTLTIHKVTVEKLYNSTARKYEDKLVVQFVGKELKMICNKTQTLALVKICGTDDYSRWANHRIRLTTATASNGKPTFVVNAAGGSAPVSAPVHTPAPSSSAPDDNPWEPSHHDDEDFYPGNQDTKQAESLSGQQSAVSSQQSPARPVNDGASPCTACHAPPGKPHASSCTKMTADSGLLTADSREGSRNSPPSGQQSAVSSQQSLLSFEQRVFSACIAIYDSSVPLQPDTSKFIRKCRNADHDSAMKMSLKYYESINFMLQEVLGCNDEEADMIIAALVGFRCTATELPGQLVHGYLMKPMRDNDADARNALAEIYELCISIWMEEQEGENVPE